MGAVWMCAREVLRRRRAGAIVIAVLIALAGGLSLPRSPVRGERSNWPDAMVSGVSTRRSGT